MAAVTAAALVPIRSITRQIPSASPQSLAATVKQHPRLAIRDGEETITFISDSQEDAGPLCLKLIAQLKGVQLGKVEDKLGWCFKVEGSDSQAIVGHNGIANGTATVS